MTMIHGGLIPCMLGPKVNKEYLFFKILERKK